MRPTPKNTDRNNVARGHSRGRIGLEIGGTFTDLVWQQHDGRISHRKVPSTPEAIHEAALAALDQARIDLSSIDHVVHGSTVATNALLERKGACVGLIATAGFRDILEIGSHDRIGPLYDIFYRKPQKPVLRRHIGEVLERIDARGKVIIPIDLDAAWHAIELLLAAGVKSLAISLINSYANPVHELVLAEMLAERAPSLAVTLSHKTSSEFREYERTMTTVVNAFLRPTVSRYLDEFQQGLRKRDYARPLQVMQSSGGITVGRHAEAQAVRMLLSGPAAGVRGALFFAKRNGFADVITLDMGGTSTDVALATGLEPFSVSEISIDHLPVRTPAIDIATVGAGGGSIARVDNGGLLVVGPESAKAYPGPACFGRGGTRATVTDAQVVAGWLRPDAFHDGRLTLDTARSRTVLADLNFQGSAEDVADAILQVATNAMAAAVRLVSTARGVDPRDYVLVAYGGGGPLHGALVGDILGLRRVLIPWAPGVTSAFGLLVSDTIVEASFTDVHVLTDETLGKESLDRLRSRAAEIASEHDLQNVELRIGLDLRYRGQNFELTIWFDDKVCAAATIAETFHRSHRTRYGYERDTAVIVVVNYRLRVVQKVSAPPAPRPDLSDVSLTQVRSAIRIEGETVDATFHRRESLSIGSRIQGPAIIEEATSTTVVPKSWHADVLDTGDVLLEKIAP